jgi:branched-chain amino acid transport system ATP-binding protein
LPAEQNLRFAGAVADRALIIAHGRIRHSGPLAELIADERLRAAYLAV